MIGIIDLKIGTVKAVENFLRDLTLDYRLIDTPDELSKSTNIILPGNGNFETVMHRLDELKLLNSLTDYILSGRGRYVGICVGFQILFSESDEGNVPGLGILDGKVASINNTKIVPHIQWETVTDEANIERYRLFFSHSFHANIKSVPRFKLYHYKTDRFDKPILAMIRNKNILGCQFHPEKSHTDGKRIIQDFFQ